jgi:iron complex transport system ATP-binding protein
VRLLEIIKNLSKTGLSVIMSSHFPDHAFSTANKVAIMDSGTFIDYGTPDEVITKDNLKKAYGIEIDLIETQNNQKICVPVKSNNSIKFNL